MENRNIKGENKQTFFSFKGGSTWKWKIVISKGGGGEYLATLIQSSLPGVAKSQGVAKALPRRC